LLDRLTVAAVVADRSGTILYANDAVTTLLGWRPDQLVGEPVSTLVHERLQSGQAVTFGDWSDDTEAVDGRYLRLPGRTPDGGEVPIGAVLSSVTQPDGVLYVALMRPRDAPHEAVNALALELLSVISTEQPVAEFIDDLLRAIGERLRWDVADLWVVDPDRDVLRVLGQWTADPVNLAEFQAASRGVVLRSTEGLPGRVWSTGAPVSIEQISEDAVLLRQTEAEEIGLQTAFGFPVEHDGRLVGVIELFRIRNEPIAPEQIAVMADIGVQLSRHLARLQLQEKRARAEQRQQLINAGTERLAAWLDYPAALDDLCDLLVPEFADACVIDLLEHGHLVRLGQAYANANYRADVEILESLFPIDAVEAGPMRVVRTGETVTYDEVDLDTIAAGIPADVPADLLERLAPTSTIIVALVGRGMVMGAMTLTRQGGPYDDEERRFAEELGRHVGLAVANAALFERERAVAEALQQSLLPPTLPEIDGLEVAARYEPGGSQLVVGGDFYDLFEVDDGSWIALVGDVCGTGAEAAAITSQVRYTARALGRRVDGPAALLSEINDALLVRGDTRFCTALVMRLRPGPDGVAVTVANGGHPPPVFISREGTRLLECTGTLLGIYPDSRHDEVDLVLRKGEALALYTDGVIETRDGAGRQLGEERLVETLDACVEEDAEKTASQLIQAAVDHAEFGPDDDIAVLVLRHP
jgi:PAS domain S-box-containing protein